jgi:hypothetical protein
MFFRIKTSILPLIVLAFLFIDVNSQPFLVGHKSISVTDAGRNRTVSGHWKKSETSQKNRDKTIN